jgi:hypothetical protein
VLGSCSSCHNGTTATGMNPGHFNTTQDCSLCHSPNAWLPADFRHTGLSYEPQDHRGNLPCTACHRSNTEVVVWSSPGYRPNCAGCHANDYRANISEHSGLTLDQNCAGSCHGGERPQHRISSSGW